MTSLDETAGEVNKRLTNVIVDTGEKLGFDAQREYPVPGGRLDVVWLLRRSWPLPRFTGALPVIAFEVESSWRSRKHVKGDLLNLHDCGGALGVIVLAGATKEDDSLRRFAEGLVDRPGMRVLVWTEADVLALAAGEVPPQLPVEAMATQQEATVDAERAEKEHRGKYRPLWEWLRQQRGEPMTVTFGDIERVIGMKLPESCRLHPPHWYSYRGSAVARAIIDAGWRARNVQVNAGTVSFVPAQTT